MKKYSTYGFQETIGKVPIFSSFIYKFSTMPVKIMGHYFVDNCTSLKFIWNTKITTIANKILEKKINLEHSHIPVSRLQ